MASKEILTVREAVAKGAEFLRNKGIPSARLDAELLVGEATGMNRLQIYLNMDRPLDDKERDQARELLRRRGTREPVAYILGKREFRSREFEVNRAVLIPRPETELLVEHATEQLAARFPDAQGAYRILEFGVGSGAIAVSLAADLPDAHLTATEISAAAAEVARRNAKRHGVSERIDLHIQPDFSGIQGPFHALVSNPPYIPRKESTSLPPEVVNHEPEQALFAEEEGTAALRFLFSQAGPLLLPAGFLLCEIGFGMTESLRPLADAHGLRIEAVYRDYAGIERLLLLVAS